MINLIEAPAPMLRVLCKYHFLHSVLVAKDMSPEQIKRVSKRNGSSMLYYPVLYNCLVYCVCIYCDSVGSGEDW